MNLRNRAFWIAAGLGLATDQITKLWVVQNMGFDDVLPLWDGVLGLFLTTNKGAAWSLFRENGLWLRWLSLGVSLGLAIAGLTAKSFSRWEQLGYGFILAGALGNGVDRFVHGEVVDFLKFLFIDFPVFNIADIWINVGIGCLLISVFRPQPTRHKK
jgi:signal peptidase II